MRPPIRVTEIDPRPLFRGRREGRQFVEVARVVLDDDGRLGACHDLLDASSEASVWERSVLNAGTPLVS
jgi:hypothetical protein